MITIEDSDTFDFEFWLTYGQAQGWITEPKEKENPQPNQPTHHLDILKPQ